MWSKVFNFNRLFLNRFLPVFIGLRKTDVSAVNHREVLNEVVRELQLNNSKNIHTKMKALKDLYENEIDALSSDEKYELARMYYEGSSTITQDIHKAIEIWKNLKCSKSKESPNLKSAYDLALCKRYGKGFEKDVKEAFLELQELATEHNLNIAHYAVANMLYDGEGIEINYSKALYHFKQAVKTGVPPALYNLANMYASGIGTAQDDARAYQLYEAAAECGDPAAQFTMACWLSHGRGATKDDEKSFQIFLALANKDHPIAAFNVGVRCFTGVGTSKDFDLARLWFEKAARNGMPEAAINLGNMYLQGVGVYQDLTKAIEAFELCASTNETCKKLAADTRHLLTENV